VTGNRDDDRRGGTSVEPAWHERTGTLAGVSLAALVVLGLLYFLISTVVRQFDEPPPVQQYFLDPTTSGSATFDTSTTTSQTITSTSPPVTSDINDPNATSTTSGTDTSSTSPTRGRPPRTRDDDPTSSRQRPRLNETRTLYPQP
jgi:cytoskeletal protein RodZ